MALYRLFPAAIGLALAACATMPERVSKADGLAYFDKAELAAVTEASCAEELRRTRHGEQWWLCGYGWRPAPEPGAEKAAESYRLFLVRPDAPRVLLRIARYRDGSGVLWAMADERSGEMQVTTLEEPEFAPLFARLQDSPLWASSFARLRSGGAEGEGCETPARWILEGQRTEDRRAVSVQSCGEGRWAIDLGADLLAFARTKVQGLPAIPRS